VTESIPVATLVPAAAPFTLARTSADAVTPPVAAAIFGAPLDPTESFRSGAAEGPAAVREFSESLETYSPALDADLEDLTLVDLGDVAARDLASGLEAIAAAMEQSLSLARLAVMVGGEHTVTLGAYRGARRVHEDAALLVLDAHLDLRDEWDGQAVTHASWVSRAGEEAGFDNIVQLGVRSGAREEWPRAQATRWSGRSLELPAEARDWLSNRPVYLSIDIDVLDPAHAPGTGCPEPGGVSFRELEECLHGLGDLPVMAVDVVEVSPRLDPSGATAVSAAKLVREAILLWGRDAR
jgi:agmatinase